MINVIRTAAVELTSVPAIAYKMKLAQRGAGLKLLRLDQPATATFTLDRGTGEAVAYQPYDADLFPDDAIMEATELTLGMPYSARGKLKVVAFQDEIDSDDVTEANTAEVDMVGSPEYQSIVARYTNEKGKLNYALLNKDLIQFASRSKVVGDMVAAKDNADDIVAYIVKVRAAFLSGRKTELTDAETAALIESLDELDPRSAFKELSAYIRRLLARSR